MDKQKLIECIKLLSTFGSKEYIELYKVLNLVNQLDEPQKVVIPKFVADWIEYCKEHNFTLLGCLDPVDDFGMSLSEGFKGDTRKCVKWCRKESNTFAIAWLFGYEVEKDKKYLVKFKNIQDVTEYLKYDKVIEKWYFGMKQDSVASRSYHTKEELISGGFGWVFSCEGVEVEEAEE